MCIPSLSCIETQSRLPRLHIVHDTSRVISCFLLSSSLTPKSSHPAGKHCPLVEFKPPFGQCMPCVHTSTIYYWGNPRLVQEQPQESGIFIVLICLYLQEWVIILWILRVHKDTHMARYLPAPGPGHTKLIQLSNSTSLQSSSLEQRKGSSSAFVEPTARNMAMSSLVGTSLRDGIFVATGLNMLQQFMKMHKIMLRMSRDPDWNQWPGHWNAKLSKKWCTMHTGSRISTWCKGFLPQACSRRVQIFSDSIHWLFQDFGPFSPDTVPPRN